MIMVYGLVCQVTLTVNNHMWLLDQMRKKYWHQVYCLFCCVFEVNHSGGGNIPCRYFFLIMEMLYFSIDGYSVGKVLIFLFFLSALYLGFEQQSNIAIEIID